MSDFLNSYALVIGINDYNNGISPLKTPANDATEIARILEIQHHYTVNLLLDSATNLSQFRQVLEIELPKQIKESDRFLFYFAGHGIALNGEDGPEGYLVPQDARLGNVSTYFPMSEVNRALLQLPCRHFLGILDCCFAGAFRWSSTRKAIPMELGTLHRERYDRFIQDPAWQVVTSAAYDQSAWDAFDLKDDRGQKGTHSPFACALIEALEGKADACPPAEPGKPAGDGVITASELYLYLRDRIEAATEARAIRQTPGIHYLNKHDKGEYIFLTPGHALNLPPAPPLDGSKNPYRGLLPFEEQHSDLFFGRKALTQKLYEFVTSHSLTVVLGASGSGKSSVVKAGLIPKLRGCKNGNPWLILPPFRPGESPFKALNNTLGAANLPAIATPSEATSSNVLTASESLANWFKGHPQANLVLTIDQFEELITLCHNDQERQKFLEALAEAIATYPNQLHLVLTLRSDFEPQFRNTALEKDWQTARFVVPAMTREELRQAIEEPASLRVMYFDSHELVDQLIDEVANMPGALPLLSFALSELYLKYLKRQEDAKNRGETIDRAITQADYEELGGVTRSLTQRANQVYEELTREEYQKLVQKGLVSTNYDTWLNEGKSTYDQTIRNITLRMVAVEGELARRRVFSSELEYLEPEDTRVETVIQRFLNARLLISDIDSERKSYVEPAHDALVRGWQQLLEWKQKHLANLLLQRELAQRADKWSEEKSDKRAVGLLWDIDPRLPLLEKLRYSENSNWLNAREAEFVDRSIQQKRFKRHRLIGSISTAFAIITLSALVAVIQRNQAIQSQIDTLITLSEGRASRNDQLGALLASVQAGAKLNRSIFTGINEATRQHTIATLRDNLYTMQELNRLEEHSDKVSSVSFSPNGRIVASSSEDSTVSLWWINNNLTSTNTNVSNIVTLRVPGQRMTSASFSPDSRMIVTGSEDNRVRLWKVDGSQIQTFEKRQAKDGHRAKVTSVIFSPDGQVVASGSEDKTIQLRRLDGTLITSVDQQAKVTSISFSPDGQTFIVGSQDGQVKQWNFQKNVTQTFKGHQAKVTDVSFSPNGQLIASASEDKTVKIWRLDGILITTFEVQTKVTSVSFSPDGRIIALGNINKTVQLWDVKGTKLQTIEGHKERVASVKFSPDGQKIASGSWDGTVKLWSFNSRRFKILEGHTGEVWGVRFSRNGQMIASAGAGVENPDNTVRLWNVDGREIRTLRGHAYWVTSVDFSPDGQMVVSSSAEKGNNIRLWSIDSGKSLPPFKGHEQGVWSVRFSPDGKIIASASEDKKVKLWNLDGTLLREFVGHGSKVWGVSFSPDGKIIASASDDKTVKLWNLDGTCLQTLKGHKGTVITAQFSPDGNMIASGSDDTTIRLWKLDGTLLRELVGHKGAITSLSFSSDGKVLATASEDRTIKIWRVSDGVLLQTLQGHQDRVWGIDFSPKGNLIVSASDDRSIILWHFDNFEWNIKLDELLNRGCYWLHDYLNTKKDFTSEERPLCPEKTPYPLVTS